MVTSVKCDDCIQNDTIVQIPLSLGCCSPSLRAVLYSNDIIRNVINVINTHTNTVHYNPVILIANWNGFHDDESGIMGYAWCIGTDIGSCDVLPFEDPHRLLPSRETWTNSALAVLDPNLQDGDYYITVRVESNVEYGGPLVTTLHHSTPYQVDTVPPEVADMMLEGYSADQNELRVSYTAM